MQEHSEQELAVQEQASQEAPQAQEPTAEKPSEAAERPSDTGDFRSLPEFKTELETAREQGYRQGQGDFDRRLAGQRKRWEQQTQQTALVQHLSNLQEEDPDEFTRLISQPEVAEVWAKAKQQPRQQALREAADLVQAEFLKTFVESDVLNNVSDETRERLGRVVMEGPKVFWSVVFGDLVDELADANAQKKAEKMAQEMADAKYEAHLAKEQKKQPSPDVGGSVGGVRSRANLTSSDLRQMSQEEIANAKFSSEELTTILSRK